MPELKALTRERELRGYSQLRKAQLIELLTRRRCPPHPNRALPPPTQTWEPQTAGQGEARQPKLEEAPLTKKQLKHRKNKKFKNLEKEIDNLKSQMDSLKDKITNTSESTNARCKRKTIRSMKRF